MKIFELSGLELAELVRQKQISPVEVVEAYIKKIEDVNPRLNAMVEPLHARARDIAHDQSLQLAKTKKPESLPKYFGVPFTIKEMLAVEGCHRTAGNIHHRDDVMDYNSTVVDRMIKAGAIPLGTTNVPELGFWFETDNAIYGRTNNPYDQGRTSGGSSGGESALIGAGASPFGLGSDIGGSIRMPASFCGIFGHKPTWKTIPLTGHFPTSREDLKAETDESYAYTTLGFLSRRAKDLFPLMQILSGPDQYDPQTKKDFVLKAPLNDFSKLKVFIMPNPQIFLCQRTDHELQECVKRAGELFQQWGATVEELDPKLFKDAVEIWGSVLSARRSISFTDKLTDGQPMNYASELLNVIRGQPHYMFTSLVTSLLEKWGPTEGKTQFLAKELESIHHQLTKKLGPNGVLIMPPHPRVAPKHRTPWLTPFDFAMTGIFNVLAYPATSVPMGLNPDGLPLGIQVVALPFCDHINFSVAEAMESTFGGWVPPETFRSGSES